MLLKPDVGDAELITAVRGGDLSAYGTLFERHVEAARRLARQLTNTSDADDLVSDAFAKVLRVLQNGGGPDLAFRAYLLTAVRRLHVDKIRAGAKVHTTDDLEKFDPGVPFRDTAVEGFENSAAAAAFASLPERWQLVLWHTEVEGQKPADVAELLGMSANSVSALAYRAREGLRQAFLNSHIQELDDTDCRWTHDHLGAYVRNGVSKRDGHKVEEHLDGCRKCMAIYLELTEVNSNLSGILAPIILGAAASGYLASGAGVVKVGFLVAAAGRVRDGITSNVPLSAAVGVAAVSTVVGVSVAISLNQGGGGRNAGAEPPNAPVASSSSTTGPTESQDTDPTSPDGNDPARRAGETSSVDPSATTDATATDAAASDTADATDQSSDGATDPGGSGDTDGPGDNPGNPGGPVGNPPETQPEFDYDVPQGQRTTTIPISRLVQDADGDELSFVDASLPTPDHGDLTITSVTAPTRGTAAPARTEEALVYVPDRGWGGRELVTYRVTDGHHTVRGTFRIRTVNDPPVANDESRTTPFGEAITVDLLANDTDPDGDPLTLYSYEQQPAHGTVTRPVGLARLFADASDEGVVTYHPDRGWEGVDTVSYVVDDGAHQSTATLTVTTEAAPPDNEPPVIADPDITETTEHATAITIDVIERAGITDPDGDPLTLSSNDTTHGDVTITGDSLTYTPEGTWAGDETVTYTVTDGRGGEATGTITITTNPAPPPNQPPVIDDDDITETTEHATAITVDVIERAGITDPDGDPLTLDSNDTTHGDVTITGDSLTYTPEGTWAGDETVTYTVTDGRGGEATGTITITTNPAPPPNQPPVIDDDDITETTEHATAITVDVIERAGITDPDGDPVALDSAVIQAPAHGTVEVFRATGLARLFAADSGSHLVYTPNSDWAGTETITYVVSDGRGGEATGTLRVTTQPAPANRAPHAVDDDKVTPVGQSITVNVIANDTDEDGDPLHLVSAELQEPRRGRIEIVGDEVTYYPAAGFLGTATITYVVSDGRDTDTGVLTVETLDTPPVNRAPITVDDFAETGHAQTVIVDVAADDTDPDGDPVTLASTEDDGLHGDAVVDDGKLSYTPDDDWAGDDTVTYTVTDGRGGEATGILTVKTLEAPPVNRAPITVDDFAETGHAQTVIVDVAADDTDPDGDPVTLASTEDDGLHGDAVVDDGKLSYTPDDDWAGDDTVTYTVTDGRGGEATGILTVKTLEAPPVNRAPITVDDFAETGHAQTVIVDVAADDTDPDGDPVTLASTEDDGLHGDAVVDDGKLSYTPDDDWAGDDTVTYTVTDGRGGEATGILTVKTLDAPPANHAPAAENDFADTEFETSVSVDVLTNDTDGDGDDLTLVPGGLSNPANGSAEVVDGELVYTPDDDWAGEDTVTYTVTDGTDTDTAVLTVTTNPAPPINQPPIAVDDPVRVDATSDGTVRIDVVANDWDPDGDALALVQDGLGDPDHGSVRMDGQDVVFTYDNEFAGTATFTYEVTDGQDTDTATVRVNVMNGEPVAQDDRHNPPVKVGDPAVTIDVLDNDSDPNGDALTLVSVGDPDNGTAEVVNGKVVYTADDDATAGPEVFTYTVRDSRGGEDTAEVRLTVARPMHDLDLQVGIREPGINQRFEVRAHGATTHQPAELVVTWEGILERDRVFAPDFCERTGDLLTCLVTNDEEFDIRFQQLPILFSLRMELRPLPPYVDPTPEVYTWRSWL